MLALDRYEFKGNANRKHNPTLCLSTRRGVPASLPAREIRKDAPPTRLPSISGSLPSRTAGSLELWGAGVPVGKATPAARIPAQGQSGWGRVVPLFCHLPRS